MPAPRVIVLRAPGTNCDAETAFAFERAGARPERVHLFRLLEQPHTLRDFQILCIPGGFSYGDDVGAGVIFADRLRAIAEILGEYLQGDKLVLGICNGFQVLLKAGVLPDGASGWPPDPSQPPQATLTWNDNGRYTARWVHLATAGSRSVFLKGLERLELPIAHGEGKIAVRTPLVVDQWNAQGQIALRYAQPNGSSEGAVDPAAPLGFPYNPNGSEANIAGLCDATGRVLGLMPHPERHIFPTQHPQWTRREVQPEVGDGMHLFTNAVAYFG